ncbi:MAG: cupin [Elusimicrobia bacterium GWA2_56_46]|nr:MAG: cupin [Elusimicrobia bacterium GWA2_56_46]OGR55024.1 MAG: cupin [Elusimicrobia bacterium GWC2_56_31]HBB67211.1 cupin [Elusimicrobiota bacterium]HBW23962.1 cupin [Elusimicrobiota bacterium]
MKIEVRKPTEKEREEASSWPVWEKEVSSFPWHYGEKEVCLILEGEVTVKAGSGEVSFGSGDYVIFPEGLDCVWNIKKAVRKHYKFG